MALAAEQSLLLKDGDTFAVFSAEGEVAREGSGEQGLYHEDTRFLSRLELRIGRSRPVLLAGAVRARNDLLQADLTNPELALDDGTTLPRGALHLHRSKFLWRGCCHERVRISNHGLTAVKVPLAFAFEADFADIFEVRGMRRQRRGTPLEPRVERSSVLLGYHGLDAGVRRTRIDFHPLPRSLTANGAVFEARLEPQASFVVEIAVTCEPHGDARLPFSYDEARAAAEPRFLDAASGRCRVTTSNPAFNAWLERSAADLDMLVTPTAHGAYPYAGLPWYSTIFGRDGIVTALETLWMDPGIARGVLGNLAALQADAVDEARDAAPGKILHEMRRGEMAATREVPFGRYYGTVDATPLFVALAAAYFERTGDRPLIERLWPHVERALGWIETHGDPDHDGFLEYAGRADGGLVHQGWKDSNDAVSHADGRLAEGPVAVCEVQGYAYAALRGAAGLAAALGLGTRAAGLNQRADALRDAFEARFWSDELATYALALDGRKEPCLVRSSNAGHVLYAGIATPDRAARVARTLLDDLSFSGWGVRTLSAAELRYNPMSYHNGSVWPHDNALVAAGLARYGLRAAAARILTGMHEACVHFPLQRMPELFCGFRRRPGDGPTLYPGACAPQAWSAAAVFLLLQACLGLRVEAAAGRVVLEHPVLPEVLDAVRIQNLSLGDAVVDLELERHAGGVSVNVARRKGDLSVMTIK